MKMLYLECNMGAAGDMLMGALLELLPAPDEFVERFNRLGIPGVTLEREASVKCGITGTHMAVRVNGGEEESLDEHEHIHEHEYMSGHEHVHEHGCAHGHGHTHEHTHGHVHASMQEIQHVIRGLPLTAKVQEDAIAVYSLIAEAESHAHGVPVTEIHFHEVGTMDAVADVVGVCMLLEELAPETVMASPVCTGFGQVRCAHGILPVPAPATAWLLRGVPTYGGSIEGEMCTPTGAALLKHFVTEFTSMPVMRVQRIGYGMGKKEFPSANCIRAMLGEQEQPMEDILELCCNLDDMTPEGMGFVTELLMEEGALDVYTTPVQMKKNRPGWVLSCMCRQADKERFLALIFRHTTTLGIREYVCRRYGLEREVVSRETSWGIVRVKRSSGYGTSREKAEYEDLARIARERDMTLEQVRNACLYEKEDL